MKLFQPTQNLEHCFADTIEQLGAIATLRYESYSEAGFIEPSESRLFIDEYDFRSGTTNIGFWREERMVAAMRLHEMTKESAASATYSAFSDVLEPKLDEGIKYIDFARFVVAPDLGRERLPIMAHALYVSRNFAVSTGANIAIAAVREAHIPFYKRVGGFEQKSEPRAYEGLTTKLALISVPIQKELHYSQD